MMGLPAGWAVAPLGALVDLNPKHPADIDEDTKVSFVPMAAVSDRTGSIEVHETRRYGDVKKGYTHFRTGDVIFAKITPCMENGKSAVARGLTNGLACGSTEFYVLRSRGAILPELLHRYVRQEAFKATARAAMTGVVGQARVPREFLETIEVPVPPLAEQRRIADKLDDLLARVDECRDRLDRLPAILKRFRQAVLAAAFRGDLTASWRNARSRIAETVSIHGLPPDWRVERFGDVTQNFDGRRVPIKDADRKLRPGPYPYWGASGPIDSIDDFIFDGEYLLISEDGKNLLYRRSPIAFLAKGKFWVNNHAHIVQPKQGVEMEYLLHFFNHVELQPYLTGIDQVKLTQGGLNQAQVPVAPIDEQREMIKLLSSTLKSIDLIERSVAQARRTADQVEQSALAKAFRGELVSQAPNDDPASVLLDRIRAERAWSGPAPKKRGRRTKGLDLAQT